MNKQLNFTYQEALGKVFNGEKMRLPDWNTKRYIVKKRGMILNQYSGSTKTYPHTVYSSYVHATDWQVYQIPFNVSGTEGLQALLDGKTLNCTTGSFYSIRDGLLYWKPTNCTHHFWEETYITFNLFFSLNFRIVKETK